MLKFSEYMLSEEAAKYIGVSDHTLYNWEKKGKIKVYRNPMNNYRMYRKEDLDALLQDIEESCVSRNLREV
jgi:MerR family transcriptional regulator, copper efflux regulator